MQLIPAALAGIALVTGVASNVYCETVSISQTGGDGDAKIFSGIFYYKTREFEESYHDFRWCASDCYSYTEFEDRYDGYTMKVDSHWRVCMAFAIIGSVVGALAWIASIFIPCTGCARHPSSTPWHLVIACFFIAAFSQGLTLLILQSSICEENPLLQYLERSQPTLRSTFPENGDGCEWEAGFRMSIAATVFWLLAAIAAIVIRPKTAYPLPPRQEKTITYSLNADGTITKSNEETETHERVESGIEAK